MTGLTVHFGGLNTELSPHRVPSGTADRCVNILLEGGQLVRRPGFARIESNVTGGGHAVLSMFCAGFADADVYLVCKCADGFLWQRKLYPADAGSFTKITTAFTHHASDRGWWFMWYDRLHYFDRNGGSRWNPDVNGGTAYRAGLRRPSYGPTITAAAGGEKDGRYHVQYTYRNSVTREESVLSSAQTGATMPLDCRYEDGLTGGIAITDWATIRAADTDYEWDQIELYCTDGHSEFLGAGDGVECFSYYCYAECIVSKDQVAAPGMNKADHVLRTHQVARHNGGEPYGAEIGCYDGIQAVYAAVYSGARATATFTFTGDNNDLVFTALEGGVEGNEISVQFTTGVALTVTVTTGALTHAIVIQVKAGVSTANEVITAVHGSSDASILVGCALTTNDPTGNSGAGTIPGAVAATKLTGGGHTGSSIQAGRLDFSLPNFPTMVPNEVTYRIGGDATTLKPHPWIGSITTGFEGPTRAAATGGGVIGVFTPTKTYRLTRDGSGRLWPQLAHGSIGCVASQGAVGTPGGVHALGYGSWIVLGGAGVRDIAEDRIGPTLDEMPVSGLTATVGGYFGLLDQVWFAIVAPGCTKAQRILVYDRGGDRFTMFDLACLGTRAALNTNDAGATNNDLTFTAERPGAPGNDLTVAYAVGGTAGYETVAVDEGAITVTLQADQSTAQNVMDALHRSGDATAILTASLKAGNDGTGVITAAMTATALAGGASDAGVSAMCEVALPNRAPTMYVGTDGGAIYRYDDSVEATLSTNDVGATNNDLTFTAIPPGAAGNNVTVTYAAGATAGSEVATASGWNITVTIESGVSTAAQVAAAINASATAAELVTVANKAGNDGTGVVATMAKTNLAGGSGGNYDHTSGYAGRWRCHVGQERMARDQKLQRIEVHAGENVAGNVRLAVRAMRTADEAISQYAKIIQKSELRERSVLEFSDLEGQLFQVELHSPHSLAAVWPATEQWTIRDLILRIA